MPYCCMFAYSFLFSHLCVHTLTDQCNQHNSLVCTGMTSVPDCSHLVEKETKVGLHSLLVVLVLVWLGILIGLVDGEPSHGVLALDDLGLAWDLALLGAHGDGGGDLGLGDLGVGLAFRRLLDGLLVVDSDKGGAADCGGHKGGDVVDEGDEGQDGEDEAVHGWKRVFVCLFVCSWSTGRVVDELGWIMRRYQGWHHVR
jgi:hypothetical protein